MRMKTVLTLMVLAGAVLGAYTLRLHEHVLSADDNQVRHACQRLCKLGMLDAAGAGEGALGGLAGVVAARACEAVGEETGLLAECRERLTGLGLTVATYRCVVRAKTREEALACDEALE